MPSASDGPCSPHQGRTRPGPSRTEQAPEKGPVGSQTHAPGVCEGTSRPQHHHRKAAVAGARGKTPSLSPPSPRWVPSLPPSRRFSGVQLLAGRPGGHEANEQRISYLVDPASSHMLVSKIKPCMSKYRPKQGETANGSLNQLWFIGSYPFLLG